MKFKLFILFALLTTTANAGTVIDHIVATGRLKCGAITEPLDWNKDDLHAILAPLDVEMCRAVATAVLGAPDRFDLQSYNSEADGLAGLMQGKSDIVAGVTPGAGSRGKGRRAVQLAVFPGQPGFMVHRSAGIRTLADITGHKLCYIDGTDNDAIVLSTLGALHVRPVPFPFQEEGEMDAAIMDLHCQVTSALISKLAEARASFHNARDYVFLPDTLSLVPATVAVDGSDARLAAVVDYTLSALLQAEFLGVTRASAASMPHSEDPRMQRLLGEDWATAQGLGLAHDWSRRVIEAVGNYGEIFDRTVGPGTPFNLPRGLNALWNKGGTLAPLPLL